MASAYCRRMPFHWQLTNCVAASAEVSWCAQIWCRRPACAAGSVDCQLVERLPVPEPIKVDPQELAHAAERVRGYAEQLRAGHGSSVATADRAQHGLVGQSAQAIDSKTQRWQTATAELHRVLSAQADAVSSAAAAYAHTEENNRDMIASLDPTSL